MITGNSKANKKFDKDLKYGERFQNQIHNVLINSKLEMKCERDRWMQTGNVFIEYECNGKPSGVCKKSTESDFWIHGLDLGGNHIHCAILFKVSRLQKIVAKYKDTHTRKGGDGYRSLGVVLPISKLFEKEVIDIEKDNSDFWGEWKEDVDIS